ncbi:hypothetical protein PILCRDRAFT_817108 [Piloderma croceum F 1598]|uniref:Uncharacterized protein n=1 Tax=Piloderma croceum (strain F 1598) TaxID=765440 RepID=A0A0C3C675_PILCF|nr:hypothetical protein PILCRDRAFT_817108 [Piloderma croceum F 1598]
MNFADRDPTTIFFHLSQGDVCVGFCHIFEDWPAVNDLKNSAVWRIFGRICYDEDGSVKSLCFIVCIFSAIIVGNTEFEWLGWVGTIRSREAGELGVDERFQLVGDDKSGSTCSEGYVTQACA